MGRSRYMSDPRSGNGLRTARAVKRIRDELRKGNVAYSVTTLKESQRLDQIAAQTYGDGRLWWLIAACSNIGWSMQCPAGTVLKIPTNINSIMRLV